MQFFLKNILQYIMLACFAISLTIMFLGMRSVMDIGGFCAEGGPYEIAVHCPKGIAGMMPLSIFGMLISGVLYFIYHRKGTPNFTVLFWTALFASLGWNFLEYAIYPPEGEGLVVSWLICGILFELMGFAPLLLGGLGGKALMEELDAQMKPISNETTTPSGTNKFLLWLLPLGSIAAGIYLGMIIFYYFST